MPRPAVLRIVVLTLAISTIAACAAGLAQAPREVGTNGTLQTRVPAPTYASDRLLDAFTRLNAARRGAGAGLVAQSPELDTAAANHAAYLSVHGFDSAPSPHFETAGLSSFTGFDPFVRMLSAGYKYSYATEVIGEIGSSSPTTDCVGDLLGTIYHGALMLSRVIDVGIGFGTGDAAGMCSISLASPLTRGTAQVPPSGAIVAYPYAGAVVAHGTFLVNHENPRAPITLLPNPTAGTPVLVSFRNQDYVSAGHVTPLATIARFRLTDASGAVVPSVVLADATIAGAPVHLDIALASGFAVLVPVDPLAPGRYNVDLQAEVSGGRPLALTSWSFDVVAP